MLIEISLRKALSEVYEAAEIVELSLPDADPGEARDRISRVSQLASIAVARCEDALAVLRLERKPAGVE